MSKIRTMRLDWNVCRIEGEAWGARLPLLIFEDYENGEVSKRVSIQMRPTDVADVARRLWELHSIYQIATDETRHALQGQQP